MMNKPIPSSFQVWAARRRGGVSGLIATICLTGAAIMVLTQALGRQARSIGRASEDGAEVDAERKLDEKRWRLEVTTKLEEILARVPYVPQIAADPDSD